MLFQEPSSFSGKVRVRCIVDADGQEGTKYQGSDCIEHPIELTTREPNLLPFSQELYGHSPSTVDPQRRQPFYSLTSAWDGPWQ